MRTMTITDFKARCIAALNEAQRTGAPLVVTRRGKPLARIEPIPPESTKRALGALRGFGRITADLLADTDFPDEWEMEGGR